MKVIVFGCQQIAVDFIHYLTTLDDIEVPLVVTYELPMDKTYEYKSVMEESRKLKLEVRNPNKITDKLIDEIKKINPHVIFSIYYRKIFAKGLLSIPKLGCINIHPSLLPEYRGPIPTAWSILNGEKRTGVTIHLMDEGIDTGDILIQEGFEILENETGYELYTRTMKIGGELLKRNLRKILNQEFIPKKQEAAGSFYGKMKTKDFINWQCKARDIVNLIRVRAKPYNPTESILFNRYLLINRASIIKNKKYTLQGVGRIVDILDGDKLVISCADGFILLEEYEIFPKLNAIERDIYLKIGNKLS